jgi:tRNA (guanine37-N1)-methyltransferase
MRNDVLTLFPALVDAPLSGSIVGRARQTGALDLQIHDIREWTSDVHRTADDTPYGGGAGMVMKIEPIVAGVEATSAAHGPPDRIAILSASGIPFTQALALDMASLAHVLLICGHYEGIDERVKLALDAEEISIGDYVLTGGELAAAVVIDCVSRLLPGVIKAESIDEESHSAGLLEYPQYTRPASFRGLDVPEILVSGNHARIKHWRHEQALLKTAANRPDLLSDLSETDKATLRSLGIDPESGKRESR